jgi:hypothetical protein
VGLGWGSVGGCTLSRVVYSIQLLYSTYSYHHVHIDAVLVLLLSLLAMPFHRFHRPAGGPSFTRRCCEESKILKPASLACLALCLYSSLRRTDRTCQPASQHLFSRPASLLLYISPLSKATNSLIPLTKNATTEIVVEVGIYTDNKSKRSFSFESRDCGEIKNRRNIARTSQFSLFT